MNARLILLLAVSATGALGQYVYDSTDTWTGTIGSRWQQNGSFAFNSGHLTFSTFSGGSLISTVPITGSNSNDLSVPGVHPLTGHDNHIHFEFINRIDCK